MLNRHRVTIQDYILDGKVITPWNDATAESLCTSAANEWLKVYSKGSSTPGNEVNNTFNIMSGKNPKNKSETSPIILNFLNNIKTAFNSIEISPSTKEGRAAWKGMVSV
jgi:hypothetical protein